MPGPVTAAGVTGTFGTITRSGCSVQATFDGHPLYTYIGDTATGQANGNIICLVEVKKENWSFGNGIAQYA